MSKQIEDKAKEAKQNDEKTTGDKVQISFHKTDFSKKTQEFLTSKKIKKKFLLFPRKILKVFSN